MKVRPVSWCEELFTPAWIMHLSSLQCCRLFALGLLVALTLSSWRLLHLHAEPLRPQQEAQQQQQQKSGGDFWRGRTDFRREKVMAHGGPNSGGGVNGPRELQGRRLIEQQAQQLAGLPCDLARDPLVSDSHPAGPWPPPSPAVYTNATAGWAAHQSWRREILAGVALGAWRQPLSTFMRDPWLLLTDPDGLVSQKRTDVTLREYMSIVAKNRRNVFLFLRHEDGAELLNSQHAAERGRFFRSLASSYAAPAGFPGPGGSPAHSQRFVHIFAMDGTATGHGMHRHHEAWLAQVAGRKVWWLAPPIPRGEERLNAYQRPQFPYKNMSMEEGSWPCWWALQASLLPPDTEVKICVTHPGAAKWLVAYDLLPR